MQSPTQIATTSERSNSHPAPDRTAELVRQANEFLTCGQAASARDMLLKVWETEELRAPPVALALARARTLLGETAQARDLLSEAGAAWPKHPGVTMARTWRAFADGDTETAYRILAPALEAGGMAVSAYLLMARIHTKDSKWQEGLRVLEKAESLHGTSAEISELRTTIFFKAGLTDEACQVSEAAFIRWPENRLARQSWARALLERKRFAECMEILAPGLIGASDCGEIEARLFATAAIRGGFFSQVADKLQSLRHCWEDLGRFAVFALAVAAVEQRTDLAELARQAHCTPLSAQALSDFRMYAHVLLDQNRAPAVAAMINWLGDMESGTAESLADLQVITYLALGEDGLAHESLNNLLSSTRSNEALLGKLLPILENSSISQVTHTAYLRSIEDTEDPQKRAAKCIKLAEYLLSVDDRGGARAVLEKLDPRTLDEELGLRSQWMRSICGDIKQPDPLPAQEISPSEVLEDGLVRHYRFGESLCVLWFSGIIPSMAPVHLARGLPIWRELGVSVFAINDPRRLAALGGFGRYYPDRQAAETALTKLLSERGYSKFATTGTSLAAFSALTYACGMGAAGALVFATPTRIPLPEEMPDSRGVMSLRRLRRTLNLDVTDIRSQLQSRPNLIVHNHFGISSLFDAQQAALISDLRNITNFSGNHARHDVPTWYYETGQLKTTIQHFVEELLARTR